MGSRFHSKIEDSGFSMFFLQVVATTSPMSQAARACTCLKRKGILIKLLDACQSFQNQLQSKPSVLSIFLGDCFVDGQELFFSRHLRIWLQPLDWGLPGLLTVSWVCRGWIFVVCAHVFEFGHAGMKQNAMFVIVWYFVQVILAKPMAEVSKKKQTNKKL